MATIENSQPAGPTSEAALAQFEEHIGHKLPEEYRNFLLKHNGGRPNPDTINIELDGDEFDDTVLCFFPMRDLSLGKVTVSALEELNTWPLHCAWDDLQSDMQGIYSDVPFDDVYLPIGTDGGGNYYCVSLNENRFGCVWFLDHETAETSHLADGFDLFLQKLREE